MTFIVKYDIIDILVYQIYKKAGTLKSGGMNMTAKTISNFWETVDFLSSLSKESREKITMILSQEEICTDILSEVETSGKKKEFSDMDYAELMKKIGIPCNIKGYQYIKASIAYVIDVPEAINGITKVLYPDIAKKFNTTASRVERAIRHAIERAWERGNSEFHNEIFGDCTLKHNHPTNSEFVAGVVEYIKVYLMN